MLTGIWRCRAHSTISPLVDLTGQRIYIVYQFSSATQYTYHEGSGLEQPTCTLSQSCRLEFGHSVPGSSAQNLTGLASRCHWGLWFSSRPWGALPGSLAIGWIQFLRVVGLRSSVSCVLLPRKCSQLLEAVPGSWPCDSPKRFTMEACFLLGQPVSLILPSSSIEKPEKTASKGLTGLGQLHWG